MPYRVLNRQELADRADDDAGYAPAGVMQSALGNMEARGWRLAHIDSTFEEVLYVFVDVEPPTHQKTGNIK